MKATAYQLLGLAIVAAVGGCLSQAFPGASWLVYVGAAVGLATQIRTLFAASVVPSVNVAAVAAVAAKKA